MADNEAPYSDTVPLRPIDAAQRARILLRDRGICQLCRTVEGPLHIGHLVSPGNRVSDYPRVRNLGEIIYSDANLAVMCVDCYSTLGPVTASPLLVAALFLTWSRQNNEGETQ